MKIVKAHCSPYRFPLQDALHTSRGVHVLRRGWILTLITEEGLIGRGDAAPWAGFGGGVEATRTALRGIVERPQPQESVPPIALTPEAAFAWETALLDLTGQEQGVPLHTLVDSASNAAVAPLETRAVAHHAADAQDAVRNGFRHLKLKVAGASLDEDIARVQGIRDAIGSDATLTLDANGGWTQDEALEAMVRLRSVNVSWYEQPLSPTDLQGHATLRSEGMPVAIDEGIQNLVDLERHHDAGAVDLVVIKPMFAGGIQGATSLAHRAHELGLQTVYTTALESPIGRTATAQIAAAVPSTTGVLGWGVEGEHPNHLNPVHQGSWLHLPQSHGLGVAPRPPDPHAIPHPVASAARANPVGAALITSGGTRTWKSLADEVAVVAGSLHRRGVEPGSLVALVGIPDADWVVAFHAISWLGATVGLIDSQSPPAAIARALGRMEPDFLLSTGEAIDAPGIQVLRFGSGDPARPHGERFWPLAELRVVLETSGTTGSPRQVPLSTAQVMFNAMGATLRLGHLPDDRWLACMPLHHVGGVSILIRSALTATATRLEHPFDAHRVAALLDGGKAEQVSLVPTMLRDILDAREERPFPATLRTILLGGAMASEELIQRCAHIKAPIRLTWGMSETAAQACTMTSDDIAQRTLAGPPHPFARVTTVEGVLHVTGPTAFQGHHATRDQGTVDERGRVWVTGRADDVINSGGELISPTQVEARLQLHPAIREALVLGVQDARWGERLVAWVVPAEEAPRPDSTTLREWCREAAGSVHAPQTFRWTTALPLNALGKLDRARAHALWQDAAAKDRSPAQ